METPEKSCETCIFNMQPTEAARNLRQGTGVSMCGKGHGPTTVMTATDVQRKKIQDLKGAACEDWSQTAPAGYIPTPSNTPRGHYPVVMLPVSVSTPAMIRSQPDLVKSCLQCVNYVTPDESIEAGLWNIGMCATKGVMITNNEVVNAARNCEDRAFGARPEHRLTGATLVPEYAVGMTIGHLPSSGIIKEEVIEIVEPTTYKTDREVTAEEKAMGIRAWRSIEDPDSFRSVHLPIYDISFFPEKEQVGIPRTGDDEHPEQYVDHLGLVYKTAVLWMHLDETPALWGAAGTGKSSPVGTPVLTPTGWRKIGDLQIGDEVIGQNGKATKVTGVFPQGVIPVNRVTMTDGSWVLVGDDHLWQTWTAKQEVNWRTGEKRVNPKGSILSTRELAERGLTKASGYKFRIPMVEPVEYEPVNLPLDPYVLGVLLANGSLTSGEAIYSSNNWQLREEIVRRGLHVSERTPPPTRRWKVGGVWQALKGLGLAGEKSRGKFIPEVYLRGSVQQRRDLLAALLDCDGSCNGGHTRYHTMSQALADGVRELVQSLGGTASINLSYRDDERVVNIAMPVNPFVNATDKRLAWDSVEHHQPTRKIMSIEPEGMTDQVCIMVEAEDHLYVTEDYIVTHNTEFYRHMAWLMCLPFHRISITASTEVEDLAGKMHFEPSRGTYFEYGRIPRAWQKPGIICLDEPNVGPPDVWQFIRPLTDNSKQLVLDMNNGERVGRHKSAFLGLAMNPAWDVRNVGTGMLADADGSRLMHIFVDLPSPEVERSIIKERCKLDGYDIPADLLDAVMKIAVDLRALCADETLPITWGIRPQIKVARALRWFGMPAAYRLATADYLEPQQQEIILDTVKTHTPAAPPPVPSWARSKPPRPDGAVSPPPPPPPPTIRIR